MFNHSFVDLHIVEVFSESIYSDFQHDKKGDDGKWRLVRGNFVLKIVHRSSRLQFRDSRLYANVQTWTVWRPITIKHCLVTKHFPFGQLDRVESCSIKFDVKNLIRHCIAFCSFRHVWYRLATQCSVNMFSRRQTTFDRVLVPKYRLGQGFTQRKDAQFTVKCNHSCSWGNDSDPFWKDVA